MRTIVVGLITAILAGAAGPVISSDASISPEQLKRIVSQLKMLRDEMDLLKFDFLQRSIPAIEKEIADLGREQTSLETEESRTVERLQDFDNRLAANVLSPDELVQAQAIRAGIDGGLLKRLRENRTVVSSRRQHLQGLLQRWTREFNDVLTRAQGKQE